MVASFETRLQILRHSNQRDQTLDSDTIYRVDEPRLHIPPVKSRSPINDAVTH